MTKTAYERVAWQPGETVVWRQASRNRYPWLVRATFVRYTGADSAVIRTETDDERTVRVRSLKAAA